MSLKKHLPSLALFLVAAILASAAGPRYDGVPEIGEHTRTVLTELLGLTPAELDGLSGRGIIGPS